MRDNGAEPDGSEVADEVEARTSASARRHLRDLPALGRVALSALEEALFAASDGAGAQIIAQVEAAESAVET